MWLARDQWFASDDFDFVASRGLVGDPRLGLFAPHNEHWSTLPILLWRALFTAFGLRTYLPYLLLLVVAALAAVHLVWRAALRGGADPWLATSVAGGLALVGVGWENMLWAFQSAWMLALAFGSASVLAAGRPGAPDRPDRIDALGWVAAVGALASSALALPLVAGAGIAALAARGVRAAVATVAPPAGVFLVWFLVTGQSGVDGDVAHPAAVARFAVSGVIGALAAIGGGTVGGLLGAVAFLVWAVVAAARGRARRLAVPLAMATAALLFLALAGLGRAALDPGASSPRYLHVVLVLLAPALAVALSDVLELVPARARVLPRAVSALCALVVAVVGVTTIATRAGSSAAVEQAWRARVVAVADLAASEPEAVATDEVTADLTVTDVLRMRTDGDLPALTPEDTRREEARVLVGLGPVTDPPEGPPTVLQGSARVALQRVGDGCIDATPKGEAPQIFLDVAAGGGFSLEARTAGRVEAESDLAGEPVMRPRPLVLEAGTAQEFAVADASRLVLTLTGPTRVCGLA